MKPFLTAIVMVAMFGGVANATTWARDDRDDPFSDGKCIAHSPVSSGSYIYHWPSKYDLVFWPFTDPHWVWHCPTSGYVAFGSDFEFDESERASIEAALEAGRDQWTAMD